jgi:hypothetical protein
MDKNLAKCTISLYLLEGVIRFLVLGKCEMSKKGEKGEKCSFCILDDQYLNEKVDVVGVQHYFALR